MELQEFLGMVRTMSASEVRATAHCIRSRTATAAGTVEWCRARVDIERAIRCSRSRRAAALAARAAESLVAAADCEGPGDRAAAVCVARWAGDVARGMVAGPGARSAVARLLEVGTPVPAAA